MEEITQKPTFLSYVTVDMSTCSQQANNFNTYAHLQNIKNALYSLMGKVAKHDGFYHSENVGTSIKALTFCFGNFAHKACEYCVNKSISYNLQLCPDSKEEVVWYPSCMARFSQHKVIRGLDEVHFGGKTSEYKVPKVIEFNNSLNKLTPTLQARAAEEGLLQ
ncbi:cysteine-rich repeat secretory protein 1-like [Bidens hawaiensis]|uniref:cysteine-rich repeat secretory protein 1-like n=1 Tax=Bidens hawaiensis TaxID=980011 RepID=UPI00404A8D89